LLIGLDTTNIWGMEGVYTSITQSGALVSACNQPQQGQAIE
jgi:hypothetical protein